MILADKIIRLRKRNGWSQEELAAKMNVSRQAVSKWEAAQTTPDLEKILQLGKKAFDLCEHEKLTPIPAELEELFQSIAGLKKEIHDKEEKLKELLRN